MNLLVAASAAGDHRINFARRELSSMTRTPIRLNTSRSREPADGCCRRERQSGHRLPAGGMWHEAVIARISYWQRKRSTMIARPFVHLYFWIGWPPTGTSMMTLTSSRLPMEMASIFMMCPFSRALITIQAARKTVPETRRIVVLATQLSVIRPLTCCEG